MNFFRRMCTTAHRRRHLLYYLVLRCTTLYYLVLRCTTLYHLVLHCTTFVLGSHCPWGPLFSCKNIVKHVSLSFLKVYHTNGFFPSDVYDSTSKETYVVLRCTTLYYLVLRCTTLYHYIALRGTTRYYGVLRGTIRRTTRYYEVLRDE